MNLVLSGKLGTHPARTSTVSQCMSGNILELSQTFFRIHGRPHKSGSMHTGLVGADRPKTGNAAIFQPCHWSADL
jgi:hypothetical protein